MLRQRDEDVSGGSEIGCYRCSLTPVRVACQWMERREKIVWEKIVEDTLHKIWNPCDKIEHRAWKSKQTASKHEESKGNAWLHLHLYEDGRREKRWHLQALQDLTSLRRMEMHLFLASTCGKEEQEEDEDGFETFERQDGEAVCSPMSTCTHSEYRSRGGRNVRNSCVKIRWRTWEAARKKILDVIDWDKREEEGRENLEVCVQKFLYRRRWDASAGTWFDSGNMMPSPVPLRFSKSEIHFEFTVSHSAEFLFSPFLCIAMKHIALLHESIWKNESRIVQLFGKILSNLTSSPGDQRMSFRLCVFHMPSSSSSVCIPSIVRHSFSFPQAVV